MGGGGLTPEQPRKMGEKKLKKYETLRSKTFSMIKIP